MDGRQAPTYYAWWEWLSRDKKLPETRLTNVPVVAGAHINLGIWPTSARSANIVIGSDAGPDPSIYLFAIEAAPGITLSGTSAEWIVERPTSLGPPERFLTLPNYGMVHFADSVANSVSVAGGNRQIIYPGDVNSLELDMKDDGGVIVSKGQKDPTHRATLNCRYTGAG